MLCGTGEGKIPELLHKAIVEEGYTGFLTLEPHLVLFDSLQSLETTDAKNISSVRTSTKTVLKVTPHSITHCAIFWAKF